MVDLEQRLQKILTDIDFYEYYYKKEKMHNRYIELNLPDEKGKKAISYDFNPKSGAIQLVPFFDTHYGLAKCNIPKLEGYIDFILNNDNCFTILGGDNCESATRDSVGLGMMEETLHTGPQRRKLTDMLKPLAEEGKILCAIPGNHEMRGHSYNEDNPLIEIAYDLNVPYCGYQAYLDINVNSVNYQVVGWHGKGSGSTIGSKINSASKMKNVAIADLYLSGHSHVRATWDESVCEIKNGMVEKRRVVFVICGSLVDYFDIYPEQKMMTPGVTGLVLITFNGDKKYVSVTL